MKQHLSTRVELSSRLEYALLALLELARAEREAGGKPLKINEIAACQSLPERYLDQIFTLLKRQGIVSSQRGMKGGYFLARELGQISLLDVVLAIEGSGDRQKAESDSEITVSRVVVTETFQTIKESYHRILSDYTLEDLALSVEQNRLPSSMYYI
jgi:Rrf2 family protein